MFAKLRLLVLVLIAVAGASALALAQQGNAARSVPAAGPRRELTATAARQIMRSADSTAMQRRSRQNVGKPVALMIVGGAAILVGAIIGDAPGTLFMIGGAVALLIGLYQYLQ